MTRRRAIIAAAMPAKAGGGIIGVGSRNAIETWLGANLAPDPVWIPAKLELNIVTGAAVIEWYSVSLEYSFTEDVDIKDFPALAGAFARKDVGTVQRWRAQQPPNPFNLNADEKFGGFEDSYADYLASRKTNHPALDDDNPHGGINYAGKATGLKSEPDPEDDLLDQEDPDMYDDDDEGYDEIDNAPPTSSRPSVPPAPSSKMPEPEYDDEDSVAGAWGDVEASQPKPAVSAKEAPQPVVRAPKASAGPPPSGKGKAAIMASARRPGRRK
jgi:hypothetical protein